MKVYLIYFILRDNLKDVIIKQKKEEDIVGTLKNATTKIFPQIKAKTDMDQFYIHHQKHMF